MHWNLLNAGLTCSIVLAFMPVSLAQSNNPCVGPCVLTYHYDLARDGVQNNETVLTPAKIKVAGAFGKVGTITGLQGQIYGQPLYISGLNSVSSKGNVVLVATQQDYVYAFDADTYKMIWGNLYLPSGENPLTTGLSGNISCGDISPKQGITSTPVIDPHTTFNVNPTIYFVTSSIDSSNNFHQRLHAVDVTNGVELFGGPVEITTPTGSSLAFVPSLQLQRSALALTYDSSNEPQIYISWGSNCDQGAYHGWVMKYTVSQSQLSRTPTAFFVTTPTGVQGGIWGAGAALAADNSVNGNLYISSGNGTADDTANFGESVLKFSSNLSLLDWYTPNNAKCLNGIKNDATNCPGNEDLGSGGTVLFNVTGGVPELATVGKEGEIYVNYQANLGHLDPAPPNTNYAPPATCTTGPPPSLGGGPNNIAQCFQGIVTKGANIGGGYGTPAFWNNTIYTAGAKDTLRAYALSTGNVGTFNTTGAAAATPSNFPWPGASPAISWNGSQVSTGIVWVLQTAGYQLGNPAVLTAYTAVPNGSLLPYLYSSGSTGPVAVKFAVPTVANGKVFIAGQGPTGSEGRLYVYGLCPCIGPTLKSSSPNTGSALGGTPVSLTGTNFQPGATVSFGGTAATNVTVISSTQITANTPAHAPGVVNITVTNPDQQSATIATGFTFVTPISFVQVMSSTPASATAVAVAYNNAQAAGDLNVVVIGWNDAVSSISSVKDSAGNVYYPAAALLRTGSLSQAIYYASKIASGANTITVTFNQAASFIDIRILEYRGVSTLDVSGGATGSSTTSSYGPVTTTSPYELIFAANTVSTITTGPGAGFTSRIITADGDIAEDEVVNSTGSYAATAPLSPTGTWIMQMATFK